MQKEEMSIRRSVNESDVFSVLSVNALTCFLSKTRLMQRLSLLYSFLLEEKVSSVKAVYVLYAQISVFGILMPFDVHYLWRIGSLLVLIASLKKVFA